MIAPESMPEQNPVMKTVLIMGANMRSDLPIATFEWRCGVETRSEISEWKGLYHGARVCLVTLRRWNGPGD